MDAETVTDSLKDAQRATYAIGDVQGCFDDLLRLLDAIDFVSWFSESLVPRLDGN